jgi:hypothetical protein
MKRAPFYRAATMSGGIALALAAGCGAKTGLRIPDASPLDAGAMDAFDAPDTPDSPDAFVPPDAPLACMPGRFTLLRGSVEVLFVLDRSGSMGSNLDGSTAPPRRWDVLHDTLATTLPRYDDVLEVGGYAFPRRFDGTVTRSCALGGAIDVPPALHNSAAVLQILTTSDPWGATPTASALSFAGDALASHVTVDHAVALVLATDGGPNCNASLDVTTCTCTATGTGGTPDCFGMPTNCLDDVRAAMTIADLAGRGVPTFVVGLDADAEVAERMALESMARAGGRPNTTPGEPAYYSARRPDQVQSAFDTITRSITRCTLRSPSLPDDPNAVTVTLDGAGIPRDTAHMDGWDWTDASLAQMSFFGAACDRVAASTSDPVVEVPCRDR